MPFRHVISRGVTVAQAHQLLDALADLLVNLHLAGFFWGDCSLSNALFRLDAGRYSAYLVDAETGEIHVRAVERPAPPRSARSPRRTWPASSWTSRRASACPRDSIRSSSAAGLVTRYEDLWAELTREEVFAAQEQYRVDSRIKRLNELGFDVEELDIQTIEGGHKIRLRVQVVEPGHHRRRLEALTGLDVQENQARRLLNDLDHFRAWQGGLDGPRDRGARGGPALARRGVPADARGDPGGAARPSSIRPRSSTSCSSTAGTCPSAPAATCRSRRWYRRTSTEVLAQLPAPEVKA